MRAIWNPRATRPMRAAGISLPPSASAARTGRARRRRARRDWARLLRRKFRSPSPKPKKSKPPNQCRQRQIPSKINRGTPVGPTTLGRQPNRPQSASRSIPGATTAKNNAVAVVDKKDIAHNAGATMARRIVIPLGMPLCRELLRRPRKKFLRPPSAHRASLRTKLRN